MTTLTIQAADTASAMDEIAERLGKDALILSTTKRTARSLCEPQTEQICRRHHRHVLQAISHICITQEYPALYLVSLAYQQMQQ